MRALADAAERHGSGRLRTTTMQNLVVLDVRHERAPALVRDLACVGLGLGGSPFRRGTVACTGTGFCKLALTETKGVALRLIIDLESRLAGFEQPLQIHVNG